MPSNKVILACAGGRKTTQIVAEALASNKRVLLTTYTTENTENLIDSIYSQAGFWPANLSVLTWISFLFSQCAKPYQSELLGRSRIQGISYSQPSKYVKKDDLKYFFDRSENIYSGRLSDFTIQVEKKSGGKVVSRLSRIYDHIFIDEIQDMAGWDLELIERTMGSVSMTLVGDPRQATYRTTQESKNKDKVGEKIVKWLAELENKKLCRLEERLDNFRSNQTICDFADGLFPDLAKTSSKNDVVTGHDGIFELRRSDIDSYVKEYSPQILRWSKRANTEKFSAMNIGLSKGRTFDRVLIFPTKPMLDYLKTRDHTKAGDKAKLYVAVTRAKFSATFVVD